MTPGERTVAAVQAVMPTAVHVRRVGDGEPPAIDLAINDLPLRACWLIDGGLRHVRSAIATDAQLDLIAARKLTPGARAAASAAGLSWVDETGAAEIAVGSVVVVRDGRPNAKREPNRWTRATVGVAEALLCGAKPTVASTVEATGLPISTSARALSRLVRLGLLAAETERGRLSGRHVVDRSRLLDEYASAAVLLRPPLELRVGVAWRDPIAELAEVGRAWDAAGVQWAATGAVGAAMIAPALSDVLATDVYVDVRTIAELEALTLRAGMRPATGGSLALRPFPPVSARLSMRIQDLRVAAWPRVYADLRVLGVRGEEAAEHLREVIGGA